jgi:hypothetical protein
MLDLSELVRDKQALVEQVYFLKGVYMTDLAQKESLW